MSLVKNQRAFFDYEIIEKYTAGIKLTGFEVKALKAGKASLAGSHVIVRGDEAYLVGANIQPYQAGNLPANYQPERNLKLLLTKKEISELAVIEAQKGLTIVPLSVYNKDGKVKVDIAVARGKKKYDKRESIKKRDTARQIDRTLKKF